MFLGTLLSQCLSPPRCINGYRRNDGGNPASHSGGSINTPSRFMPQKPEISAGLMGLPRLVTETCFLEF